jgi:hypothetical protein
VDDASGFVAGEYAEIQQTNDWSVMDPEVRWRNETWVPEGSVRVKSAAPPMSAPSLVQRYVSRSLSGSVPAAWNLIWAPLLNEAMFMGDTMLAEGLRLTLVTFTVQVSSTLSEPS